MAFTSSGVRLAELVGSLSIATDLGMGQPIEFAIKSCVLSLRLGEALGMSEEGLREVYYQALLRYIGCNVETHLLSTIVGDEMAFREDYAFIDNGSTAEIFRLFIRLINQRTRDLPALAAMQELAHGIMAMPAIKSSFSGHCEVAQRLAARLGFDGNIIYALGQLYERWDGKGSPNGLKGEMIAPAALVVTLAQDVLIFYQIEGVDTACQVARQRRGTAYSPQVVDCFLKHANHLFTDLLIAANLEAMIAAEPGEQIVLDSDALTRCCEALADFVDIKSQYTLGHSTGVASLAERAAKAARLPDSDAHQLYLAGLIHDLGRTGVTSSIWDKSQGLTTGDWEKIRLHPYYTERIFSSSRALSSLSALAGLHHERLDGSGYFRSLKEDNLPPLARILATADVFHAMLENRPQRGELSIDRAATELQSMAHSGKLDAEAVVAVLAAAGNRKVQPQAMFPGGLSEREIEVIRLLAVGKTTRQIAEALVISVKTADHHVQNIYTKIGVSTRAGATLYALEHRLLSQPLDVFDIGK